MTRALDTSWILKLLREEEHNSCHRSCCPIAAAALSQLLHNRSCCITAAAIKYHGYPLFCDIDSPKKQMYETTSN
jgi:hypothetical protein